MDGIGHQRMNYRLDGKTYFAFLFINRTSSFSETKSHIKLPRILNISTASRPINKSVIYQLIKFMHTDN